MKNTILLIILLILFSCKKEEKPKLVIPKVEKDSSIIIQNKKIELTDEEILKEQKERDKELNRIVRKFNIKKEGNDFLYQLFCIERKSGIIDFTTIKVFKKNKLVQKIKVDSAYAYEERNIHFSVEQDVNFDGFNDIELMNWNGMYASTSSFWLFDKIKNRYFHYKPLEHIPNIEINNEKKEIISDYRVGLGEFGNKVYKWRKNELYLHHGTVIAGIEQDTILYYQENGKLKSRVK